MDKLISDKIVEYIKVNRVSSTEVSDCLNKSGVIKDVFPVNDSKFCVGIIHWTYGVDETNWYIHKSIEDLTKDHVVVISSFNCSERSLIGSLIAKFILLYKQSVGVVVIGKIRDVPFYKKEGWPVWCLGYNPVGCFNDYRDNSKHIITIEKEREFYHNSIAVCDDTGVVIIPKEEHTLEFLDKLAKIEEREDQWSYSINKLKKSTFETICTEDQGFEL